MPRALTGSLALSLGRPAAGRGRARARPADLDAYWPDGEPARAGASARCGCSAALDAALEARIERLTWHGAPPRRSSCSTAARSRAGSRSTSCRCRTRPTAARGSRASSTSSAQSFDLAGELATARPAQLLRAPRRRAAADARPPELASGRCAATLRGDLDAFDLDARAAPRRRPPRAGRHASTARTGSRRYDLAVDAGHPDYPQLLDLLGVARARPARARRSRSADRAGCSGDLERAGDGGRQRAARRDEPDRPRSAGTRGRAAAPSCRLRLSAGEPSADALAGLAALAGLRLDPSLLERPRAGAWSTAAARARAGSAASMPSSSCPARAASSGRASSCRRGSSRAACWSISWRRRCGRAGWKPRPRSTSAAPLPFLALALDLRAIDPSALAAWLDLPPVVEGAGRSLRRGDHRRRQPARPDPRPDRRGRGRACTTAAWSASALAELRLVAALAAADSDRRSTAPRRPRGRRAAARGRPASSGSFALQPRHRHAPTACRSSSTGAPAQLEGTIDLLLWAADLMLRLDARRPRSDDALGLRLVGPLDRPQIRLLEPPEPVAGAGALTEPLRRDPASSPAAPAGRTPRRSAGRARARPPSSEVPSA